MPQPAVSASQRYHQFTKYSPEGLARSRHQLDWSQQPLSYKEYPVGVGSQMPLKAYLKRIPPGSTGESAPEGIDPDLSESTIWQRQRISQLLFFSYGVTLVVPYPDQPFYMRSAPSAGGLYPAEIYLISRGTDGIPPGLYNYQVRSHSLIRFWDESRWPQLQEACFDPLALRETPLALVTTVVFYRSAWRYQDRAYRRVCLDTGHLLGNVELAANLTGFRSFLLGGFKDQEVAELLFLDQAQEAPLSVIPLVDLWQDPNQLLQGYHSPRPQLYSPTALPSEIESAAPDLSTGEWLPFLHQKSCLAEDPELPTPPKRPADPATSPGDKYNFPFCLKVSTQTEPLHWEAHLQSLVRSILERRSTRQFTGEDLELADLLLLLDFTYHPDHYQDQGMDPEPDYFDLSLMETFIVANGVTGLETGCYYYAPQAEELRQIRFKNFREEVHYLCLGQELGRDAAAVVFHTADLQTAVGIYGERAYRYLHMDAGHLGQRLNLGAMRLGLGVSGIAGFFDDQVNEVLGIPVTEAVIYITTLGCRRRS